MTFIRYKSIRSSSEPLAGKRYVYAYLCKCIWDKEKKKNMQKVIQYLGKVQEDNKFDLKEVFEKDEYKCKICGTENNLGVDHINPLSKGGNNNISNLRVLCNTCNKKKGKN